jgi:hypothetical protein
MSKISHAEPSHYGNITPWTHMEEMKWSSSGFLGVLAANNFDSFVPNALQNAVQITEWIETGEPPGGGCTLQHHLFNPHGVNGMVMDQKHHQFSFNLRAVYQNLSQLQSI